MGETPEMFQWMLLGWMGLGVVTGVVLFFVSAPYGRHRRPGWGPSLPDRWGWIVMEAPAALGLAFWFILGKERVQTAGLLFFILWEVHYIHRAFIYPFLRRASGGRMPASVMVLAVVFNLINSYFNGRALFSIHAGYPDRWLLDPRFLAGLLLFLTGFYVNRRADSLLGKLRRGNNGRYHIPVGGLFNWISSPNYLGEIVQWAGWALATWSWAGFSFALWTAANLVPRARSNHLWYRMKFPDYPQDRKALIPNVW